MFGKGMSDMLARLAQQILGMTPEQVRAKIEETGTLVKTTLAHFDGRLQILERQNAQILYQLGVSDYGEQTQKPAGYGAVTRGLIGCPDFRGPGETDGRGTAGPAGSGSESDQGRNAGGTPALIQ